MNNFQTRGTRSHSMGARYSLSLFEHSQPTPTATGSEIQQQEQQAPPESMQPQSQPSGSSAQPPYMQHPRGQLPSHRSTFSGSEAHLGGSTLAGRHPSAAAATPLALGGGRSASGGSFGAAARAYPKLPAHPQQQQQQQQQQPSQQQYQQLPSYSGSFHPQHQQQQLQHVQQAQQQRMYLVADAAPSRMPAQSMPPSLIAQPTRAAIQSPAGRADLGGASPSGSLPFPRQQLPPSHSRPFLASSAASVQGRTSVSPSSRSMQPGMDATAPFALSQPSIYASSSHAHRGARAYIHARDAAPSMSQSICQRASGLGKRMAQDDFEASDMVAKAARTGVGSRISVQPLVRKNAEPEQEPLLLQPKRSTSVDTSPSGTLPNAISSAQQEDSVVSDAAIVVAQDAVAAEEQMEAQQAGGHGAAAQLSPTTLHPADLSSLAPPRSSINPAHQALSQEGDDQSEREAEAEALKDGDVARVSVALLPSDASDPDLLAEQWVRISIAPQQETAAIVDSQDQSAADEEEQQQSGVESRGDSGLSLPAMSRAVDEVAEQQSLQQDEPVIEIEATSGQEGGVEAAHCSSASKASMEDAARESSPTITLINQRIEPPPAMPNEDMALMSAVPAAATTDKGAIIEMKDACDRDGDGDFNDERASQPLLPHTQPGQSLPAALRGKIAATVTRDVTALSHSPPLPVVVDEAEQAEADEEFKDPKGSDAQGVGVEAAAQEPASSALVIPPESVEQVMFGEATAATAASANSDLSFIRASAIMPQQQTAGGQAAANSSYGLASAQQDPLAMLQRLDQFVKQCSNSLPADCWRQLQQGARDADSALSLQVELTRCQAQLRGVEGGNQDLQRVLAAVRGQLELAQHQHRSATATQRNLLADKDRTISGLTSQLQQRDKKMARLQADNEAMRDVLDEIRSSVEQIPPQHAN